MLAAPPLTPQQYFHGSPHRIDVGYLVSAGRAANYDASNPECVYLTDCPDQAHRWGEDANEMHGTFRGWIYTYRVAPVGPASRHEHPDGFVEYRATAAQVITRTRRPQRS